MRHQCKILKHHAYLLIAEALQRISLKPHHILAINQDLAECRLEESVDMPDERGFSAARQTHDTKDLAGVDVKGDIRHADHGVVFFERFLLRDLVCRNRLKHLLRGITKNL